VVVENDNDVGGCGRMRWGLVNFIIMTERVDGGGGWLW